MIFLGYLNKNIRTNNILYIALFRQGSIIGDEDAYADRTKYTTTVKCASNTGKLFMISKDELITRVKEKVDSWKILAQNAIDKEIKVLK